MKISMKVMLLGILMVFTLTASAQNKWQTKKAETESKELSVALELTDDQSAMVNETYLSFLTKQNKMNKAFKVREEAGEDVTEERKITMQKHNKSKIKAIETIIGSDLKDKYKLFRKQLREKRQAAKN